MATPLAVQRQRHVEALEQGLQTLVRQLSSVPAVRKVILFGSYAAGRRDLFTDLDILVVMDSPLAFVERNAALAREIHVGIPADVFAYTPDEMERLRQRPFIRHAVETGRVMYEK